MSEDTGVSISAVAVRFGGWFLHAGGLVTITPVVRSGEVIGAFRSPDQMSSWELEMNPPVAKVPTAWAMPFEIWSKNISQDEEGRTTQDEEMPWIYFHMPLITWSHRNGTMRGKGREGPVLRTPWLADLMVEGTDWLGGWALTDVPPPRLEEQR